MNGNTILQDQGTGFFVVVDRYTFDPYPSKIGAFSCVNKPGIPRCVCNIPQNCKVYPLLLLPPLRMWLLPPAIPATMRTGEVSG